MWSPAIYRELLDRSRSPRVQYKHLPSALEHWSLAKRSLVGFLCVSWSSCAMRLCEVLQWSSNAWAFEKPVRQTFVKVQLLTPKSEGPNNFSWLTQGTVKVPAWHLRKEAVTGLLQGTLDVMVANLRPKRWVKPRSQGSMDRKKKGKNLRKQGGMSQGKADDFCWFTEKRLWSCSDENDRMPSPFFASNVLFFCSRLGLFLAELHPEHHVAGRIRENPRKCLRESVTSRWIPVPARRAIPPLTTAIITWPVKRAEVRHRTHRRWVWNGVNMAYFFLKPFLVCPKVLTAIRQESHHFLDKWAYLNLFGTLSFVSNIFHFWTPQTVFCLIVSGPVSLASQILSWNSLLRPVEALDYAGVLPSGWEKRRNEKNERYWQHSQSEVAKKKGESKLYPLASSTVRCYCCGCLDVRMPEICLAFKINEFATGCQQDARLRISTHTHELMVYKCL